MGRDKDKYQLLWQAEQTWLGDINLLQININI